MRPSYEPDKPTLVLRHNGLPGFPGYSACVECQDLPDKVELSFGFSQTNEELVDLMTNAYMVAKLFGWQLGIADENMIGKPPDILDPTRWIHIRDEIVREEI